MLVQPFPSIQLLEVGVTIARESKEGFQQPRARMVGVPVSVGLVHALQKFRFLGFVPGTRPLLIGECFRLLGSPGDHFLADEFSFNALTNAPLAHGVSWVPVKIDKGGLIPSDLERIMSSWDERIHGRRPHVLYSVPYVEK